MNGKWGEDRRVEVGYSLFDLSRDPGERYDVKEFHPEVVEVLKKIADGYRKELGDRLTGVDGENRRAPGFVKN